MVTWCLKDVVVYTWPIKALWGITKAPCSGITSPILCCVYHHVHLASKGTWLHHYNFTNYFNYALDFGLLILKLGLLVFFRTLRIIAFWLCLRFWTLFAHANICELLILWIICFEDFRHCLQVFLWTSGHFHTVLVDLKLSSMYFKYKCRACRAGWLHRVILGRTVV